MSRHILVVAAISTLAMPAWGQTTLDTAAPSYVMKSIEEQDGDDDGGVSGMIALGGGFMPKYEGASKYEASPFGLAAVKWRGVELNIVGTELKVDFGGGGRFLYGPLIGMSDGRKRGDVEGRLKLLNPIDSSASYGGFIGYRFGGDERGQGRVVLSLEAVKDSKKAKGMTMGVGVSYAAVRNDKFFATFDIGAKFNNAKYTRTFFGVTPAESAASGLAAYRPGGGLTKATAGLTAGYQLSRRWGILSRVQGGTYLGDAADSPIVKDGSKGFGQFVLGISYAF